jgi:hypothetical protein
MAGILLSERSNQVSVFMERTIVIAMGGSMGRLELVERIVAVDMLVVAPRAMDKEQAFVDHTAAQDGIFSFVIHEVGRASLAL